MMKKVIVCDSAKISSTIIILFAYVFLSCLLFLWPSDPYLEDGLALQLVSFWSSDLKWSELSGHGAQIHEYVLQVLNQPLLFLLIVVILHCIICPWQDQGASEVVKIVVIATRTNSTVVA